MMFLKNGHDMTIFAAEIADYLSSPKTRLLQAALNSGENLDGVMLASSSWDKIGTLFHYDIPVSLISMRGADISNAIFAAEEENSSAIVLSGEVQDYFRPDSYVHHIDFTASIFDGSQFRHALFEDCCLPRASFAKIIGVEPLNHEPPICFTRGEVKNTENSLVFRRCDLRGAVFDGEMAQISFEECDLRGTTIQLTGRKIWAKNCLGSDQLSLDFEEQSISTCQDVRALQIYLQLYHPEGDYLPHYNKLYEFIITDTQIMDKEDSVRYLLHRLTDQVAQLKPASVHSATYIEEQEVFLNGLNNIDQRVRAEQLLTPTTKERLLERLEQERCSAEQPLLVSQKSRPWFIPSFPWRF
ncbi:MAG: hypothetical protein ACOYK8_06365 [Alphaproteobacteria bacterium]